MRCGRHQQRHHQGQQCAEAGARLQRQHSRFGQLDRQHSGTWQPVKVSNPVSSGGWGAFELAARVDHYDYHGAPRGGDGRSYTVGLNWYLNDWSRLMFDYVRWYSDNRVGSAKGPDWGNSLGVRAQVTF